MTLNTLLFTVLLTTLTTSVQAQLKPFSSDGCSAFPDGTPKQSQLWLDCCRAHDFAYWKGGTYQQREVADMALRECVAQLGEQEIALIMLAGVRVGGSPFFPTDFRWGYGWPYPRLYQPLSRDERAEIEKILRAPDPGKPLPIIAR